MAGGAGGGLAEVIGHYQRKIDRHQGDPAVLRHSLSKLSRLSGVSIAVLQETGIGRTVNALKKSNDEEVAAAAKELVAKWKQIVASEEEKERRDDVNGEPNEDEGEEEQDEEEDRGEDDAPDEEREVEEKTSSWEEKERSPDDSEEKGSEEKRHKHHHHHKKAKSSRHHRHHHRKADEKKDKDKKSKRNRRDKDKPSHTERPLSADASFEQALDGLEKEQARLVPSGGRSSASVAPGPSSSSSTSSAALPSLPDGISPNYRPLPRKKESDQNGRRPAQFMTQSQDEALAAVIKGKAAGKRTAVYSGTKRSGYFGSVPSLFELCIHVLQENVDAIEECGGLPFHVLEPVLERAQPETLVRIEELNPYLMTDTGGLWQRFCTRHFPRAERQEMESWREMFERCTDERERKLDRLKVKVKDSYTREKDGQKKVKLAYVGVNAKPPRTVARAQAKNGTALPVGHPAKRPKPQLSTSSQSSSGPSKKPKMAPMMAKTLKMVRGMKTGFRR